MLSLMNTFDPFHGNRNNQLNLEVLEPLLHSKLSSIPIPQFQSKMISVRVKSKIMEFKNKLQVSSTNEAQKDDSTDLDRSCPICLEDCDTEIFICSECAVITHTECIINASVSKASCPYCRTENFKTGFYFKDIMKQEVKDAIPITREIWFRYSSFKLPSKEENLFDARKRFSERNLLLTCKVMNTGHFYSEFSIIGDQFQARARMSNQRTSRMMRDFTNSLNQDRLRNSNGERMGWFEYETHFMERYSVDREPESPNNRRPIRPSRTQILERFYSYDFDVTTQAALNDPSVTRR